MPIPGTDLSRCRCGAAFKFIGYGKRLCPPCLQRYRDRRGKERTYPKCRCGATLGQQRVAEGIETCMRCTDNDRQRRRQDALNLLADRLLDLEN